MYDEAVMAKESYSAVTQPQPERYIEDDFKVLAELDNKIAELLDQRAYRVQIIREQQERNQMIILERDRWFEGTVRQNPVDQGMDERPMYNGR